MKKITIGSFNLKNHYYDRNWDGNDYPKQLADFIKKNNITFLGTQELVKKYANKLQQELGSSYTINGKYRYGNIPFINNFNEANAIITKENVIYTETKYLAKIPFLSHGTQMPRIMTIIQTEEHFILNTHLEYWHQLPQKHQLKILYNYLSTHKENLPIITGDFNMTVLEKHFFDFISALNDLGMQYLNNIVPTVPGQHKILSHIFIPNNYEIDDLKVIQNQPINKISTHRPILVKVRKKY